MFLDMLKDKVFDYHLKWPEVRKRFEHDSRFSMLESDEKEDLFRIHQKRLKSEAKARKKRKKAKNKEKAKRLKEKHREQTISDDNESDAGTQTKTASKSEGEDSKSEKMEDISVRFRTVRNYLQWISLLGITLLLRFLLYDNRKKKRDV